MLCVNIVATLRVAESMEDIPAEVMELMQISETIPGVTFFTAYGRIFVDWMSVNLPEVSVFQSDALAAKPTNIGGRAMIRQPTADDIEMILAVITVSLPRTRWKYSCEREARVQQNKIGIDW